MAEVFELLREDRALLADKESLTRTQMVAPSQPATAASTQRGDALFVPTSYGHSPSPMKVASPSTSNSVARLNASPTSESDESEEASLARAGEALRSPMEEWLSMHEMRAAVQEICIQEKGAALERLRESRKKEILSALSILRDVRAYHQKRCAVLQDRLEELEETRTAILLPKGEGKEENDPAAQSTSASSIMGSGGRRSGLAARPLVVSGVHQRPFVLNARAMQQEGSKKHHSTSNQFAAYWRKQCASTK